MGAEKVDSELFKRAEQVAKEIRRIVSGFYELFPAGLSGMDPSEVELPPVAFLVHNPAKVCLLPSQQRYEPIPLHPAATVDKAGKRILGRMLNDLSKLPFSEAALFVSESHALVITMKPGESRDEAERRARELVDKEGVEVLSISMIFNDGKRALCTMSITREKTKPPILGPLSIKAPEDQSELTGILFGDAPEETRPPNEPLH